jgi:hypothetical protein
MFSHDDLLSKFNQEIVSLDDQKKVNDDLAKRVESLQEQMKE